MKEKVNNICVCGIITRASNPSQIFVDRKFQYPSKAIDGRLCPPGGNWFGEAANSDNTPFDTFVREMKEELALKHGTQDMAEMGALDDSKQEGAYQTPEGSASVTDEDRADLEVVTNALVTGAELFGTYIITTSGQYFLDADPNDKRGENNLVSLCCYFTVWIEEAAWNKLERLQKKFGNLSNESVTLITSLDEMLAANAQETDPYKRFEFAWAHGWAMRDYFTRNGYPQADELLPPQNTSARRLLTLGIARYEDILDHYEVGKVPPKWQKNISVA